MTEGEGGSITHPVMQGCLHAAITELDRIPSLIEGIDRATDELALEHDRPGAKVRPSITVIMAIPDLPEPEPIHG